MSNKSCSQCQTNIKKNGMMAKVRHNAVFLDTETTRALRPYSPAIGRMPDERRSVLIVQSRRNYSMTIVAAHSRYCDLLASRFFCRQPKFIV